MCQVLGNFFGGTNCVGIGPYTTDERLDPGDNGIYVIDGWKIVDRIGLYDGFVEQQEYDFDEMVRGFDAAMPESERLGEFLDSVEVPVGELQIGDEVYMFSHYDDWKAYPVVGFGQPEFNRISVWVDLPDGKKDVVYPNPPYVAGWITTAISAGTPTTTSTAPWPASSRASKRQRKARVRLSGPASERMP